jgi:spectinomycin phosphotransferase
MLASLHGCDAPAGIPVRSPGLSSRDVIEILLGERAGSWADVGPYGKRARKLIAEHGSGLCRALGLFDCLVNRVAPSGTTVLTHGEPHPGNLIRRNGGFLLIDWDTAGLALPERDLWSVLPDPDTDPDGYAALGSFYTQLCGRAVDAAAVALYRLRWDLEDICLFLAEFRAPHEQTADTQVAWAGLTDSVHRLTQAVAGAAGP